MNARIAKSREKRKQKKAMLEAKLAENTIEMNKLKNFAKKRKLSMQIYNKVLLVLLIVKVLMSCKVSLYINKVSYIQLPYEVVNDERQAKFNLPKNYRASQYFKKLPYLCNTNDSDFQNSIVDTLNNRTDLRKYLLATSDYGRNIQENINSVVTDGKFNNALVRHVLDEKNKGVFASSTPLSVTFKDEKKIVQNPVIGNLISQVNANQIEEQEVKELFSKAEDGKIRLYALRGHDDGGDGGGGGDEGPGLSLPPPPPIFPPIFPTQQQEQTVPPARPPRFLPS